MRIYIITLSISKSANLTDLNRSTHKSRFWPRKFQGGNNVCVLFCKCRQIDLWCVESARIFMEIGITKSISQNNCQKSPGKCTKLLSPQKWVNNLRFFKTFSVQSGRIFGRMGTRKKKKIYLLCTLPQYTFVLVFLGRANMKYLDFFPPIFPLELFSRS